MSQTLNTLLNLDPKQEVIDPVTGLPQSEARQEELKEDLSQPLSLYDLEPEVFGSDPYGVTRTDYVDKQLWEDAVEGAEKVYGHKAGNYTRAHGSAEQPYGKHGTLGLHVGDDYEDYAAAGQNNVNKWGNGLAKLGGKTLTNAIGGISMLGTGIYALTQGDMSKTFDNDFMNTLDDVNEWMDYKLPNYANKEYRDMGFFNKMLTANFWAGDFFGQVVPFVTGAILSEVALTAASAYTFGAAAPGQAAATVSIVTRATNILNKLFKTGNAIKNTAKGTQALNALKGTSMAMYKAKQAAKVTRQLITGAGFEAGVEARHHLNMLKDEFTADFYKEHGRAPNAAERENIARHIQASSNWVFGANMALVGAGNMMQFPKIFGPGARSLSRQTIGEIVGDGITAPYKAAYKSWSKGRNLLDAGYHALRNPLYEGLIEEGGQGWISNAAHHNAAKFWAKKHDPSGIDYGIGMIRALGDTFEESYGTKDAWHEIGMGMLIGGLGMPSYAKNKATGKREFQMQGGVFEPMRERREMRERTDELVNKWNKAGTSYDILKNKFQNYSRSVRLQHEKDGALEENDIFTYKNAENDEFLSFVQSRHDAGMYQNVVDNINAIADSSNEQFLEDFGYAETAAVEQWSDAEISARKQKVIDSALNQAQKIKQSIDLVDGKFKGVEGWSQEEINKATSQFGHHLPAGERTVENLNKVIRDQLIHSASTIEAVDRRHQEVADLLDKATGGVMGTQAGEFVGQMRAPQSATIGAMARGIQKRLSENEKLPDGDPNKLTAEEVAALDNQLLAMQAAIAMGQQENTLEDSLFMEEFAKNNPKEFAKADKRAEVLGYLRDLRKLNARRQEFIGYYNSLYTKEGQQEALTQVEFFMDENAAEAAEMQRQEALAAVKEAKDRDLREKTEGFEFKVNRDLSDPTKKGVGYYTWVPGSATELYNVKDSSKRITIDDIRTLNDDGTGALNVGVDLLTPLQMEQRRVREAIQRIKETKPEEIAQNQKDFEATQARLEELLERLDLLNKTVATKDAKGRMRVPAGVRSKTGEALGGRFVKSDAVLKELSNIENLVEATTKTVNELTSDRDLFQKHEALFDQMLKESTSPFQLSLSERAALENQIGTSGLADLGISGTILESEITRDREGNLLDVNDQVPARERFATAAELTDKAETMFYTTAEVLEQLSQSIADQQENIDKLVEQNEALKDALLEDSFLTLMDAFTQKNPGFNPQDPAEFIQYTNGIIEAGEAADASRAEILAAKPEAMAELYSQYSALRQAKEDLNLKLDEFYATEEKINALKETLRVDKKREARLREVEGQKFRGLEKVQRAIIFGTGYKALQSMLETINTEETAEAARLSNPGDPQTTAAPNRTTSNEITVDEAYDADPTEKFDKAEDPTKQSETTEGVGSNKRYKPNITEVGYGKTAGRDEANKDTNPEAMPEEQRRFFKWVDDRRADVRSLKNFKLRAVTVDNNPFPQITKDDFYKSDSKDPKSATILLVATINGKPVLADEGKPVFTAMHLPQEADFFSGVNEIGQEAFDSITEDFTKTRKAIIDSADGIDFNITGTNKGMPNLVKEDGVFKGRSVVGRLTNDVNGVKNIQLRVATGTDILLGGKQYKTIPGMVYSIYKGGVVPMELRLLNEAEVETVIQILTKWGQNKTSTDPSKIATSEIIEGTKDRISVYQRLNELVKFGRWPGKNHSQDYQIYTTVKDKVEYLVFGNNQIRLDSLDPNAEPEVTVSFESGKQTATSEEVYKPENVELLREFLRTKRHNVNNQRLGPNRGEYSEVLIDADGNVTGDTYANYAEYLMKPRANEADIPLTTSLATIQPTSGDAMNHTQFKFSYLTFDLNSGGTAQASRPAQQTQAAPRPVAPVNPEGGTDITNLQAQAAAIAGPAGLNFKDLNNGGVYNLVFNRANGSTLKFEFEKVSDTSMRFTPNQEIPEVVNKIADIINEQLTQSNGQANVLGPGGIVELIKNTAPDITAEISFEEIAQEDVAPIKSTVEAKGDTVAEAVAEKVNSETPALTSAQAQQRRNLANKSVTIKVVPKTESAAKDWGTSGEVEFTVDFGDSDGSISSPPVASLGKNALTESQVKKITEVIKDMNTFNNAALPVSAFFAADGTGLSQRRLGLGALSFTVVPVEVSPTSPTQEIQLFGEENLTYVVDIDKGTITNKETGKVINATSRIGVAVMKQVDFDILEESDSGHTTSTLTGSSTDAPFLHAERVKETEYKRADIAKEVSWFKNKFPNLNIDVVKGLIDGVGYGQTLKSANVLLSDLATEGTAYHEAWHVVEKAVLTPAQLREAYTAYAKLIGQVDAKGNVDARLALEGVQLVGGPLSEGLAEEFRTWMLTDGKFPIGDRKGKPNKNQTILQKIFQAIKDFFDLLLGRGKAQDRKTLTTLFENIKNNTFEVTPSGVDAPGAYKRIQLTDGSLMSVENSKDLTEALVGNLVKDLFAGVVPDISLPDLMNLGSVQHSDLIVERLSKLHRLAIEGYLTNLRAIRDDASQPQHARDKASAIIDTIGETPNPFWSVLSSEINAWMQQFKIEVLAKEQDETTKFRDSVGMLDANEVNVKQMAPALVKLLIATLPAGPNVSTNSMLGEGLVDYRKFFNLVLQELAGTESLQEQVMKIYNLQFTHPEYGGNGGPIHHLIHRLKANKNIPAESLTPAEFTLQQQFRQQFHKFYSEDSIAFIEQDTNNIRFVRSDSERKTDLILQEFKSNLKDIIRRGEGPFIENADGTFIIDAKAKMKLASGSKSLLDYQKRPNIADAIALLGHFGMEFTSPQLLTEADTDLIFENMGEITNQLVKLAETKTPITEFYSRETGAFNRLKNITAIQARQTTKTVDLQHQSADGKTNYAVILNNFTSNVVNRINSGNIPSFLLDSEGQVLESVRSSIILNGVKDNLQIGMGAISGVKHEGSRVGNVLENVSGRRLFQVEFSSVLQGKIPMIRPSEKKTEFAWDLNKQNEDGKSLLGQMPVTHNAFRNQMMLYLRDELVRSKVATADNVADWNRNRHQLRIFGYLPIDLGDIETTADIDKYLNANASELEASIMERFSQRSDKLFKEAVKNGVFLPLKEGKYAARLDHTILDSLGIRPSRDGKYNNVITEGEAMKIVDKFNMLHTVGMIEQSTLIFGDLGFFKRSNLFKRTSGPHGPKKFADASPRTNAWLAANYSRTDGKIPDGKLNITVFRDVKGSASAVSLSEYATGIGVSDQGIVALDEVLAMQELKPEQVVPQLRNRLGRSRQATQDIERIQEILAYTNFDEADAFGAMSLDEYLEFHERVGTATPQMRASAQKLLSGQELTSKERKNLAPVQITKPQYFGPQKNGEIFAPAFLKLAVLPLHPGLFKGNPNSPMANMYNDMIQKQVGLVVFESGAKVGKAVNVETNTANNFYADNGQFAGIDIIQELDYEYFGVQVEQEGEGKTKVTKGTQQRSLIGANAYDNGVPMNPRLVSMEAELTALERATVDNAFAQLTDDLGITVDENGIYSISDDGLKAFANILKDEGTRRELDDSFFEGINLFLDSDVKVLDLLGKNDKIESLLYALVSNRVIRGKVFGGAKVQIASTGFESGPRSKADVPFVYQDQHKFGANVNALQFYKRGYAADGITFSRTNAMEIMLPHYFKELLGENVEIIDGNIYSDGELVGTQELLEIYGFRIPTSALNSIDVMRIKGFLSPEAGEAIMMPSEQVVKAGSDFDNDKMTIFLPNYLWDSDTRRLIKIPYLTENNSTVETRVQALRELDFPKYHRLHKNYGDGDGITNDLLKLEAELRGLEKELWQVYNSPEALEVKEEIQALYQQAQDPNKTRKQKNDLHLEIALLKAQLLTDQSAAFTEDGSLSAQLQEVKSELEGALNTYDQILVEGLSLVEMPIHKQNAQKAIDNRIMDLSKEIVLDADNFGQLIRPVGAPRLKAMADRMRKLQGKSEATPEFYDLLNFENILETARNFWGGKHALGMAAVVNTHHPKAQKAGLGLNITQDTIDALSLFNHSSIVSNDGGTPYIPLGNRYDANGEHLISEVIGEFITAFVDVANDPFVFGLNANLNTFTMWSGLLRVGVPLEQVASFMTQKGIRELVEIKEDSPGISTRDAIDKVSSKYRLTYIPAPKKGQASFTASDLTQRPLQKLLQLEPKITAYEELIEAGENKAESAAKAGLTAEQVATYYLDQLSLLDTYGELSKAIANPIHNISKAIKSDRASGAPRSRATARLNRMEVNTLFASQDYVNLDKYLEEGFVGSFDTVLNHSAEMFNSLFISDRVPEGRQVLDRMFDRALQLPNVNDKQKYVDMLEHNFVAFIASTVSNNNGEAIHQDAVRLMQGTNNIPSLPRRIQTLQKQLKADGKSSLILDELFPILELGSNRSENFGVENLVRFTKRLATYDRNRLIEDFEVLMDNDPQLADDIIKFNILQSGFMTSPVSFASLLPAKHVARVLEPILENYIDRGGILNLNEFEKQFAQNNYMNPVAVERRRMYYNLNPQGMEPTRFERDHMLVKVRDGQRPVAERQLGRIKPPEFIVVTGIPSRHRKEGAYTAQEKLALQEQGKPTTLTRIFQLEPGTVARWEQNQEAMSTQEGRKELRKKGISTKARYFEITRKGNGRYMSEYNAAGDISIIGENNMLLSGVNLTKEHGNIRIQNRLDIREGGPIQEGNILELPGVPIIPVAAAGNASSLDLARKAGPATGKGIISPDVMKVPFTANENAVTAIIKEDFSGPVNDAMFVAAIANIESVARKNPDTTFLLPPIGLGINDGNTSDQITSKVNLLADLVNNIPNLVMILDPNPTLVEKEHVENLNNMFKCK